MFVYFMPKFEQQLKLRLVQLSLVWKDKPDIACKAVVKAASLFLKQRKLTFFAYDKRLICFNKNFG